MKYGFLLFLLIPSVFATAIFDEYVYSGESYQTDDYTIEIILGSSARVIIDDETIGLSKYGICKTYNALEYCLGPYIEDSCTFDTDEDGDIDEDDTDEFCKINQNTFEPLPVARFNLTENKPDIKIERSISDASPYMGDETTFSVTIINEGNERVTSFIFTEYLPSEFEIKTVRGISRDGQTLTYERSALNPDDEIQFEYTIVPQEQIKASLVGLYSYNFDGKAINEETSIITIDATFPVELTLETEDDLDPGTQVTYNITLDNKVEDEQEVVFSITLPPRLDVIDQGAFTFEDGVLSWDGDIEEVQSFEVIFFLKRSETYELDMYLKANDLITSPTYSIQTTGKATGQPSLELQLGTDITTTNVNERVELVLLNPENIKTTKVSGTISSFLFDDLVVDENVNGDGVVYLKNFKTPNVLNSTSFDVNFIGEVQYELLGEFKTIDVDLSQKITIVPLREAFTFSHSVIEKETNIYRVESSVQNELPRAALAELTLLHKLPPTAYSKKRVYSKFLPFVAGDDSQLLLSYDIRIPGGMPTAYINATAQIGTYAYNELIELPQVDKNAFTPIDISFSEGEIIDGFIPYTVTISNPSEYTYTDILVEYRPNPGYEFAGQISREYEIMDPTEALEFLVQIRPTQNGSPGDIRVLFDTLEGLASDSEVLPNVTGLESFSTPFLFANATSKIDGNISHIKVYLSNKGTATKGKVSFLEQEKTFDINKEAFVDLEVSIPESALLLEELKITYDVGERQVEKFLDQYTEDGQEEIEVEEIVTNATNPFDDVEVIVPEKKSNTNLIIIIVGIVAVIAIIFLLLKGR